MLRFCKALLALAIFAHIPAGAYELNLYPEAADKNAVFVNVKAASIYFDSGFDFTAQECSIDYVQPFFVPLSLGVYFKRPNPNLKSFGIRLGYHINIESPSTNLYALYIMDFGYLRNKKLIAYGDTPQEKLLYDFRIGVRQRFGKYVCLILESENKLSGLSIGISIKLN
ncbi:MAG: hypothetical protein Ta2A_07770 [Treponemataceae bacterium]|nr:MAG: hypothetical protein Ta2A_07770 [Treponemataceae bacterium]